MIRTARAALVLTALTALVGCPHDHASHRHDHETDGAGLPHHANKTGPDVVVLRGGRNMDIAGKTLQVGDKAPNVVLMDTGMSDVELSSLRGKVVLISIAPSLDTSVCSSQTLKLDTLAEQFGPETAFLSVSRDLPYALDRWSDGHEINQMRLLSDAQDREFGEAYGVLMERNNLLARGLIVVGRDGRIRQIQLVHRLSDEPDYSAAMAAVREALAE